MQLYLKHMCQDNSENSIRLDIIFYTGNKKIVHYYLTSVTTIHNVFGICSYAVPG